MPDAASRIYAFGGGAVEVVCDEAATRVWLDEVLLPWFGEAGAPAPDYRVELVRAADPLDALGRGASREPDGERACFALDTRTLSYPAWEHGDRVVLCDAQYASHLEVGRERARVVAQPGDVVARVTLMRSVREVVAVRAARLPGMLALHAAGFTVSGRTVLVLGPKEAGKTTLLLHVLATGEAELLTNDRAFVRVEGAAPHALGVPTFVRVRQGTLAIFPELGRGLSASPRPYYYGLQELARLGGSPAVPGPSDASIVMTPAQLCHQLRVAPSRGGALAAVLLPERTPEPSGAEWKLEALGADDARTALLANRYGLASRGGPPTVFEALFSAGGGRAGHAEPELVRQLASRVPVYRCRVGSTHRSEPERARALLRSLSL